jgi:hypothetical protein
VGSSSERCDESPIALAGALGLAAAALLGLSVTLTDQRGVLPLLRRNVAANAAALDGATTPGARGGRVAAVEELNWDDDRQSMSWSWSEEPQRNVERPPPSPQQPSAGHRHRGGAQGNHRDDGDDCSGGARVPPRLVLCSDLVFGNAHGS